MKYEHVLDAAGIEAIQKRSFPQAAEFARIVRVGQGRLCIRLVHDGTARFLRPGGTISGPTLMTLADTAAYFLVLSLVGDVPLAVTTHLSINFMRKPAPGDLDAEARMLKLGKRLAVCDVLIESVSANAPVAHAQVTYSIPPR